MSESLTLSEAVPLGYAVLARVAEEAGVRMLAIKGPILAMQGLREPRQSVDIDVLVDPRRLAVLVRGLEAIGWRDDHAYNLPGLLPHHSVNHRHPAWPCEVDVHHWFPGFLTDPQVTFEVLWERRSSVVLAGMPVPTADVVAHAALAALHYLREAGRGLRLDDLESLAVVVATKWNPAQRVDLEELAAATGAGESLRPFLERVGVAPISSTAPLAVPLEAWELRTEISLSEVSLWLLGLSRVPWRERPRFAWKALWLDARQLPGVDPAHPPRGRALLRMRLARLRRAFRAFPGAYAEQRRLRKKNS